MIQARQIHGGAAISGNAVYMTEIHNVLARFFEAFDDKNWTMMQDCLGEDVFADYSSFRDVPASTMPAAQYIEERRAAFDWLDTQHNFRNLRATVDDIEGTATARCNYHVIRRFHSGLDGIHYFHSYGHYHFDFVNIHGGWKITRIKQHLLRKRRRSERSLMGVMCVSAPNAEAIACGFPCNF